MVLAEAGGPNSTLQNAGVACIIAAVIGGGLKAFGIELPLIQSAARQVLLALLGCTLIYFSNKPGQISTSNRHPVQLANAPAHEAQPRTVLLPPKERTSDSPPLQDTSAANPQSEPSDANQQRRQLIGERDEIAERFASAQKDCKKYDALVQEQGAVLQTLLHALGNEEASSSRNQVPGVIQVSLEVEAARSKVTNQQAYVANLMASYKESCGSLQGLRQRNAEINQALGRLN